jgi:hypothetical protein
MPANVQRWSEATVPEMHERVDAVRAEGLEAYRWDDDAGYAIVGPEGVAYLEAQRG